MPTDEDADPCGFRPARCSGYKLTVPKPDKTVRQASTGQRGYPPRLKPDEFRQSGKVWLITVEGMKRVFGPERGQQEAEP